MWRRAKGGLREKRCEGAEVPCSCVFFLLLEVAKRRRHRLFKPRVLAADPRRTSENENEKATKNPRKK